MDKSNPYKDAGVDTEKADSLVGWLKKDSVSPSSSSKNQTGDLLTQMGGFAACFRPNLDQYQEPILVSCTDGIGTKLLLGIDTNQLSGLGQDLAAMCLNDLYTLGARPSFFLDYFATGRLDPEQFKVVVAGLKKALDQAQCLLVGGETAELPGLYQNNHFDMAGFVVGMADRSKMIQCKNVKAGDLLVALPSSGFHSNGYSLLRKWLKEYPELRDQKIIDYLMEPTRIYHQLNALCESHSGIIAGASHITGGGFEDNVPRMIPEGLSAVLDMKQLNVPETMQLILTTVDSKIEDLTKIFNLGVGMVLAVDENHLARVNEELGSLSPYVLGRVEESVSGEKLRYD